VIKHFKLTLFQPSKHGPPSETPEGLAWSPAQDLDSHFIGTEGAKKYQHQSRTGFEKVGKAFGDWAKISHTIEWSKV
jgi:hypothetical protein